MQCKNLPLKINYLPISSLRAHSEDHSVNISNASSNVDTHICRTEVYRQTNEEMGYNETVDIYSIRTASASPSKCIEGSIVLYQQIIFTLKFNRQNQIVSMHEWQQFICQLDHIEPLLSVSLISNVSIFRLFAFSAFLAIVGVLAFNQNSATAIIAIIN
uniref:Uncharacterized protein n=1 Tax=Glossina brevipalpis TaxID=37001 RepID=A0A1A9WCY0_9MUSC